VGRRPLRLGRARRDHDERGRGRRDVRGRGRDVPLGEPQLPGGRRALDDVAGVVLRLARQRRQAVPLATLYRDNRLYRGEQAALYFQALTYEPGWRSLYARATYPTRRRALGALAVVWSYGAPFAIGPASRGR
jgi:hypothetical protein